MKRNLLSFASLAFLVFAGWQVLSTLSRAPAFNRSLQVEAATGGGLLRYTEKMFSSAPYYYWIALDWYLRTAATSFPGEEGSVQRKEAMDARSRRIRDTAIESLRHSPGDASTWLLVAKAEAALGDGRSALEAYLISYDLAPHSAVRALDRMYFLIRFMSEPESKALALSMIAPETVLADLEVVRRTPIYRTTATRISRRPAIAAFGIDQIDE